MSIAQTDCLDSLIGLSRNECRCTQFGKPDDFNVTTSGLYLDEQEGLNLRMIEAADDCEQGGLWEMMSVAREEAGKALKADAQAELLKHYKLARYPFSGLITEDRGRDTYTPTKTYNGLRLCVLPLNAGVLTIKRIGLLFNGVDNVNWSIYSNVSDDVIASGTITTVANTVVYYTFPTPLDLVMLDTACQYIEYFIIYEKPASIKPKNNKITCSCDGFRPVCSYPPTFGVNMKQQYRWYEYMNIGFVSSNDLSDRENWGTSTPYANGIIVDLEVKCHVGNVICENLDFDANPASHAMAYAERFKAAAILVDKILASGNINRYTMMEREQLYGKRNSYLKHYTDRIAWLGENLDASLSGCWACNPRLSIGGIRS